MNGPSTRWPASSVTPAVWTRRPTTPRTGFLGNAGMVELVSLCGYYTLVSFLLNAFAVPLPPDARPMWAES